MGKVETRYVEMYRQQYDFCHADAPLRGFVGGRGTGKSRIGCYDLIMRANTDVGLYGAASPTYGQYADTTGRMFEIVATQLDLWDSDRFRVTPSPMYTLPNGSEIIFRSADKPDRFRGPNMKGWWLDEASLMSRDAYMLALATLREGGMGWLSATFTPKGMGNWTYEVFAASDPETGEKRPGVFLIHARMEDNPFISREFKQRMRQEYGSSPLAQQELDGQFVDVEGAEFLGHLFGDKVMFDVWPEVFQIKAISLDPSKGGRDKPGDYSAIVFVGLGTDGKFYVEADLDNRRTAEKIVADLVETYRRWNADVVGVETNVFQELLLAPIRAASAVMPIKPIVNTVNKDIRIRRIGFYLENDLLRFKRGSKGTALLVQQLRDFPVGDHDDGPDALEMAIRKVVEMYNTKRGPRSSKGLRA